MEFFRIHKTIPFMRYSHILNAISLISFIIAVFWLLWHGLTLSIEFTGGTQVVVQYPEAVQTEQIRELMVYLARTFDFTFHFQSYHS